MQLTLAGEYAVRTMIHLASQPPGEHIPISNISQLWDIPEDFLRKIVAQLGHAGLVKSRRGKTGGICIAGDPEQLTLLDVIEAVEGPIFLNKCLVGPLYCSRSVWCEVHLLWNEAQEKVKEVLRSRSLSDLARCNIARLTALQSETSTEPSLP